jgi:signal transduction histidine kinase
LTPEGIVKVSVRDTGVGLQSVDTRRMFALSYTTKPTGSGVGLSISRAIVEAHGGQLWAEQNAGRGATFSFTIPLHATMASSA